MIRHGDHGMSGASIETTLELWASSLREVKRRTRPLFTQARVALSAENFLEGLLGEERRKTGWMRAEAAGDPGPWRQQAILGRGQWDADALRDIARDYALETLADDDAVLVIDETGFSKQGKASCGVARHRQARVSRAVRTRRRAKIRRCAAPLSCHGRPRR
jgi:SRSO17 transposase